MKYVYFALASTVFVVACQNPSSTPGSDGNTQSHVTSNSPEPQDSKREVYEEGPGFNVPSDYPEGTKVRQSAEKVVEVWASGLSKIVDSNEMDLLERQLREQRPANFRKRMLALLNEFELRSCRARQTSNCRVTEQPFRGSGFIVGDEYLVTASHNFDLPRFTESRIGLSLRENLTRELSKIDEKWVTGKIDRDQAKAKTKTVLKEFEGAIQKFRENPFADQIFVVADKNENILFTSQDGNFEFIQWMHFRHPSGQFSYPCEIHREFGGFHCGRYNVSGQKLPTSPVRFGDLSNDIAIVRLHGDLRQFSIALCTRELTVSEPTFNVGYPIKTEGRSKISRRDATDRELVVGPGKVLSIEDVLVRGRRWYGIQGFAKDLKRELNAPDFPILSSSDAYSGMSGGPLLNSEGEVCGLHVQFLPASGEVDLDKDKGTFLYFSSAVNIRPYRSAFEIHDTRGLDK